MKRMFQINDVDIVLTNKSIKETVEWYEKDYDEVYSIEEVKNTTMSIKGFWTSDVPPELVELFTELNSTAQYEEISINELEVVRENNSSIKLGFYDGELCMWKTLKEEMDSYNGDGPYIVCSTEY